MDGDFEKNMDVKVKVTRKSKAETDAEIWDMKWQPIFTSIMAETDKKFDEITGFAYSFHPMPLQIIIKTSLSHGWMEWDTKRQTKVIENYVRQIVEIKREELSIEKIPYKIIIRSEEHKKIN